MALSTISKTETAAPYTLSRARCGERLRVVGICQHCPERARLHELGFCERVEVRKLADGCALICQLRGTRVAIGCALAAFVHVEKMAA